MKKCTIIMALTLIGIRDSSAQDFTNLDFESANLSGYSAGSVSATDAIPGWTAYLGGTALTNINYDVLNFGTSGPMVDILDGTRAIQGNYSIYIQGSGTLNSASIGQTVTIPLTAQSLIWWGIGNGVSFNGQPLSVSVIGTGPNYYIIAANISTFAGQTGQLLFTSTTYPGTPGNTIDNIQFSSSPVPEPGVLGLLGLGGLAFLWHRRKSKAVP